MRDSDPNPADPYLVLRADDTPPTLAQDPVPALPDEVWAALLKLGRAGGRLVRTVFDPGALKVLEAQRLVIPMAVGRRVEITGLGIRVLADAAGVAREPRQ